MVASCQHIIISSSSKKNCKSVLGQLSTKNRKSFLNPFTKERRDLKFGGNGVVFRGEAASNTQKNVAPPKRAIFDLTLHLHADFLLRKFHPKFVVGVEKSNVGNRLKRVLAKFEANQSYPRGVNGRSKFEVFFGGGVEF